MTFAERPDPGLVYQLGYAGLVGAREESPSVRVVIGSQTPGL